MQDELIARLALGEKIAARRADESTKFNALERAARIYKFALGAGQIPGTGNEWSEVCRAAFEAFGCDDLHEMWRDAAPPTPDDTDLFGNPVLSMQARIASTLFDEGKQL